MSLLPPTEPLLHGPDGSPGLTPAISRRLAAFLYEGVLLFGLVMIVGLIYSGLFQMRHALEGQLGLQVSIFVVFALYFVWFWTHGGQTLAMKAWHVRVVDVAGCPVSPLRALARYLAAYLWFLPSLISFRSLGMPTGGLFFAGLSVGILTYAALAWLHPQRQFLHDALCGTRLINWRHPPKRPKHL